MPKIESIRISVEMTKIHLDTDLGGDIDDLCALAMLLHWEDVEIAGITTVAEAGGRRAGYVRYVLELEGKRDIPVAAGADVSQGYYRYPEFGYPVEQRYWTHPIPPLRNDLDYTLQLLKQNIEREATIIAIGPFTNLYLLDQKYPGILTDAKLFLMGGYVYPIRPGFPKWSNEYDWNIQVDVRSAKYVLEHSNPTLIPLTLTVETAFRRKYLNKLKKSGNLGELLTRQAEAFAEDEQNEARYGQTCEGLPADIINFLHDPLACAIALGWNDGVEFKDLPLIFEEKEGWLYERIDPSGKPTRLVTKIDSTCFNEFWFEKITKGK
jgi:inosine-uridine nucleoside N-ribohydrolase